jgi:hypothetical protein
VNREQHLRSLYVNGDISIEEFEHRIGELLALPDLPREQRSMLEDWMDRDISRKMREREAGVVTLCVGHRTELMTCPNGHTESFEPVEVVPKSLADELAYAVQHNAHPHGAMARALTRYREATARPECLCPGMASGYVEPTCPVHGERVVVDPDNPANETVI